MSDVKRKLPNILTTIRMAMISIFIVIYYTGIENWNYIVGVIVIIGAVTDFVDGYLARKWHVESNYGKLLDPIADKLLVVSALLILMDCEMVAAWACIIIIAREFIVSGFRLLAASSGVVLAAGTSGKIKTAVQMVGVILLFFNNAFFAFWDVPMGEILIYASVFISIWSCISYYVKNRHLIKENI